MSALAPHSIADLAAEFRRIGIEPGDNVILHSSYKCVAPVEKGPSGVVQAMLDAIGPAGNLMVPTFSYCLPMWNMEPFDITNTRSKTGAITEAVRLHPQALRSFHPTHSTAVIGPDAETITRNHMHASAIGLDSPFGKMHARKAKILMLGTHQDTNSSLHYCEVKSELGYIDVPFTENQPYELAWFFNEVGQIEYTQVFEVPGCSRGFRAIEDPLRARGVLRDLQVFSAQSQLLRLDELVQAADEILRENPTLLLCNTPTCTICPKRRRYMESQRPPSHT
jgi:aminoglycoside 3-N-acetyltransferase